MMYRITWTEISEHAITLGDEETAELFGVSVDKLAELNLEELDFGWIADDLADYDGFKGLTREDIEVRRVRRRESD